MAINHKIKQACETLIEMWRINDQITGILLHYSYHQNYYKRIGIDIDLSRQTNMSVPLKINFTGKL